VSGGWRGIAFPLRDTKGGALSFSGIERVRHPPVVFALENAHKTTVHLSVAYFVYRANEVEKCLDLLHLRCSECVCRKRKAHDETVLPLGVIVPLL